MTAGEEKEESMMTQVQSRVVLPDSHLVDPSSPYSATFAELRIMVVRIMVADRRLRCHDQTSKVTSPQKHSRRPGCVVYAGTLLLK